VSRLGPSFRYHPTPCEDRSHAMSTVHPIRARMRSATPEKRRSGNFALQRGRLALGLFYLELFIDGLSSSLVEAYLRQIRPAFSVCTKQALLGRRWTHGQWMRYQ